jgi:hypothetical protein
LFSLQNKCHTNTEFGFQACNISHSLCVRTCPWWTKDNVGKWSKGPYQNVLDGLFLLGIKIPVGPRHCRGRQVPFISGQILMKRTWHQHALSQLLLHASSPQAQWDVQEVMREKVNWMCTWSTDGSKDGKKFWENSKMTCSCLVSMTRPLQSWRLVGNVTLTKSPLKTLVGHTLWQARVPSRDNTCPPSWF